MATRRKPAPRKRAPAKRKRPAKKQSHGFSHWWKRMSSI